MLRYNLDRRRLILIRSEGPKHWPIKISAARYNTKTSAKHGQLTFGMERENSNGDSGGYGGEEIGGGRMTGDVLGSRV